MDSTELSPDQLAANLQKVAILVKKQEKDHPLIRQTIHDLTYFVTGKRISSKRPHHQQPKASSAAMDTSMDSEAPFDEKSHERNRPPPPSTVSASKPPPPSETAAVSSSTTTSTTEQPTSTKHQQQPPRNNKKDKPYFQRPNNPNSVLIANGWVEQQRRSKMRSVWKTVLCSLVQGRRAGEETTLWIQRETTNHGTGKIVLEALHQIPVKWIQTVTYQQYSTDHQFVISVHNLDEEFVFRCPHDEEAAQNWVLTLRSVQESVRTKKKHPKNLTELEGWEDVVVDEKKMSDRVVGTVSNESSPVRQRVVSPVPPPPSQQPKPPPVSTSNQKPVKELRAIAHGAGISTHGMERGELETIVAQILEGPRKSPPPPPPQGHPPPAPIPHASSTSPPSTSPPVSTASHKQPGVRSIKELRAIAHGVGVTTHGMERGELETLVAQIEAPSHTVTRHQEETNIQHETETARLAEARRLEERKQQVEEAARRRTLAEAALRSRQIAEEERLRQQEDLVRRQQEEKLRKQEERRQQEEQERQRYAAERQRREEEEHRKRVAELQAAEQRRRQEEQQRQQQQQWAQQQAEWQQKQAEEHRRRQAEEQRAAEERRRQEEAYRQQQQQWQQHNQQSHPPPPAAHHQRWGSGGQQQQFPFQQPPFGGAQPPPPPPQNSSPVNKKYAKMASAQTNGDVTQIIKHGVLVEWALQPPSMNMLRPIETLIATIHTVFPPKYGVPGHDHFSKWVKSPDVMAGAHPDEEKLKKTVRKLRFLLHPDKLPREFSEQQQFICKMLWDITSDAFEEWKKREEDLGWMRN